MRVLHINGNFLFTNLHQCMIKSLSKYGIDNSVFVPMYNKSLAVLTPDDNVTVSECFNKWDKISFNYKQSKIFKSAEIIYKTKEFDIIHAYTLFSDGNCAMNLSQKYGIPYVVAVRNTDVNIFLKKMIHLRKKGLQIMLNSSAVFFLSESYKNQVFHKYVPVKYREILDKKTYIIPNGIDGFWLDNIYEGHRPQKEEINAVYAGRINKNKNITAIQRAIKILNKKGYNIKLTVVGKVESQREFDKIISDYNTCYLKQLPKEKLICVYRESDFFIMPSFSESFGLVYAEAMSQKLPVIYTKGQGFDGQFEEGVVGYSVDPHNAEDIADKILKILLKKHEIEKACVNNVRKYDWDIIARRYISIYDYIKNNY